MSAVPSPAETVKLLKGTALKWPEKLELGRRVLDLPESAFPGRSQVLLEWACTTMARVGHKEDEAKDMKDHHVPSKSWVCGRGSNGLL